MRVGFHLPMAGGLLKVVDQARRLGLDCLQIFAGNPRGWKHKPLEPCLAEGFRAAARNAGLWPVTVHAPYLLNLASSDDELWEKSIGLMADQLAKAGALGADAVVLHPGSRGPMTLQAGIERVARGLEEAFGRSRATAQCWLENTAGGGRQLGATLTQLGMLLGRLEGLPVKVCLDTAHAWAAGYRINDYFSLERFLARADAAFGLDNVGAWHLNDTVHRRGSLRDQHCHLGRGEIGVEGFKAFVASPRLKNASVIMETPKESRWSDRRNLAFLRRLIRASCRNS